MAGRRLAALVVVASVAPVAVDGMAVLVPLGIAVVAPAVVLPYTSAAVVVPVLVAV